MLELNLELPKQVAEIVGVLDKYGYSAYLCGECVRLLINGQTPFEYEVLSNIETARIYSIFDGYNMPAQDESQPGTVTVGVLGLAVTIIPYTDLKEELSRKYAFTFDAVAYSPDLARLAGKSPEELAELGLDKPESPFADFWGGLGALERREIDFIESGRKFNPHDILPALALHSSQEFTLTERAKQLIAENAAGALCLRADLEAVITGRRAAETLSEFSGIFAEIIPELKLLSAESLARTFARVGSSSPVLALRYALLFGEIGKPDCHSCTEDGEDRYYGHAERSRIYAARIMRRLGCPDDVVTLTGAIIKSYERVSRAEEENLPDLRDEFPDGLLRLALLYNCAVFRAIAASPDSGEREKQKAEKAAMKFKALSKRA